MNMIDVDELIKFRDERMKVFAQQGSKLDRKIFNIDDQFNEYGSMFVRNEFSKDRDRIKFSRAFRRLEDKAQIYSHEKGDHFRTRLTHSIEVNQIGRSLARNLNLNEDLVEAISLGHDIGHTPFGHQGERTLDNIMSGKDDLSGKVKFKINYGGFKHNFHSLKILDQLEVKYKDVKGMNLTWQVLEGILKHTKIKRHKKCEENCGECWDISRFLNGKEFIKDCLEYDFSVTLEGQIVAIADEIAQRQHDVDDGLRDIDLKLNFEKVAKYLVKEFEEIIDDDNIYTKNLRDLIDSTNNLIEVTQIEREELYKVNALVRNLIDFFIKDVTINSLYELQNNIDTNVITRENRIFFGKKFIFFSSIGEKVNEIIESYIKSQILNSYNVNRFDGKSIYIVRQLFKAYYTNPRQMPEYILVRLSTKIKEISNDICTIKLSGETELKDVNFKDSKPNQIDKLIKLMKLEVTSNELNVAEEIIKKLKDKNYLDKDGNFEEKGFIEVNNKDKYNIAKEETIIKTIIEIHYSYLSVICDYIAGMTDNYASSEFKSLYLVN